MEYVPVRESLTQKHCIKCGEIAIYENLLFESKIIFHCLSYFCGHEELVDDNHATIDELLGSISNSFSRKNKKDTKGKIEDAEASELIERYNFLVDEISTMDQKKVEAESLYSKLKNGGIKIVPPPWTPRGWHTSPRHDYCALCGAEFVNRQSYRFNEDHNPVCRYGCRRNDGDT